MRSLLYPCLLTTLAALLLAPSQARAGGLYLTDRGSRSLGRGGAFVAGADDGQSLWYNPAGLAHTGRRLVHADGTLARFQGSFQRVTRDGVNGQPPNVDAKQTLLPIPTFALSDSFGTKDWNFGIAGMAPNAVLLNWPETVDDGMGGRLPGPTRYSLISMKGSIIANLAAGIAWHGIKGLSIGAGVHVIPARFRAGLYLNACDYGVLCTHAEDPEYEAQATISLKQTVTATGTFGLIYALDKVRVGASVMLPYTVGGTAKLDVNLPGGPLFGEASECTKETRNSNPKCAHVIGDQADVALQFPMVARLGVEVRPTNTFRAEVDVVYEGWSRQRDLKIKPHGDVRIENAVGVPLYQIGTISIPRQMQDVYSLRVGGELRPMEKVPVILRAGVIAENGSFKSKTLTPFTLDSNKLVVGAGFSFEVVKDFWIDGLYAHIFMKNMQVRDSIVYPANPIRPRLNAQRDANGRADSGSPEPVGNGDYVMEADVIGGGLRWNI